MIGVRWTIGDVSPRGFDALRLSVWGAWKVFGARAGYVICVNTLGLEQAQARTGSLPGEVTWLQSDGAIPDVLAGHLDAGLAEGVAWKFAPARVFLQRHELALDNDCILWEMPEGLRCWLDDPDGCLLAEDAMAALGQFAPMLGDLPRNTGIRGLPPGFALEAALAAVLHRHPVKLLSELDEQGLQVAALAPHGGHLVRLVDVAICSPFPPHTQKLGRCGAHFVGINVHRERPYCDQAVMAQIAALWDKLRPEIAARVGADRP